MLAPERTRFAMALLQRIHLQDGEMAVDDPCHDLPSCFDNVVTDPCQMTLYPRSEFRIMLRQALEYLVGNGFLRKTIQGDHYLTDAGQRELSQSGLT